MTDFHHFSRDFIWVRRRHPALRSEPINVYHVDNFNRVIAYHRWLPGVGRDVVVVVSLREQTFYDRSYALGSPDPAIGTRCSTATSMTTSRIPGCKATPVASTRTGHQCTAWASQPASPFPRTASSSSPATTATDKR